MRELSGLLRQGNQAERARMRADPRTGKPSLHTGQSLPCLCGERQHHPRDPRAPGPKWGETCGGEVSDIYGQPLGASHFTDRNSLGPHYDPMGQYDC